MKQLWKLRLRKRPSSYFDSLLSLLCPEKIYMDTSNSNVHKSVKKSILCHAWLCWLDKSPKSKNLNVLLPCHEDEDLGTPTQHVKTSIHYRLYNPWRGGGSDIHQTIHFLLNIQRSNPTSSYCGSLLLSNFILLLPEINWIILMQILNHSSQSPFETKLRTSKIHLTIHSFTLHC